MLKLKWKFPISYTYGKHRHLFTIKNKSRQKICCVSDSKPEVKLLLWSGPATLSVPDSSRASRLWLGVGVVFGLCAGTPHRFPWCSAEGCQWCSGLILIARRGAFLSCPGPCASPTSWDVSSQHGLSCSSVEVNTNLVLKFSPLRFPSWGTDNSDLSVQRWGRDVLVTGSLWCGFPGTWNYPLASTRLWL